MDNIKDFLFKFLRLENLVSHLSGYVESRIALVKLEIREEVAHGISKGITALVLMLLAFLFLLFLSLGVAHFLNRYFEDDFAGYFLVGGFYGLVFLILVIFRENFLHSFEKKLLEIIRKKEK
jgi:hypothetical protein